MSLSHAEVDRKHPLANSLTAIRRLKNFESIALTGLQDDELADLLEKVGDQSAPEQLVKLLREATEGNPLFLRELLLHLLEEGKILREGQGDIGGAMLPPPEGIWGIPPDILNTLRGYDPDVFKNRAEARDNHHPERWRLVIRAQNINSKRGQQSNHCKMLALAECFRRKNRERRECKQHKRPTMRAIER